MLKNKERDKKVYSGVMVMTAVATQHGGVNEP
jgi:hypothetical protein